MSTKKAAALNVLDLGVTDFADESVEIKLISMAPDKTRVELTLVCVNEISEGARNRYRNLMRKYAGHFQKMTDDAKTEEEKAQINDSFMDVMRRCDAASRAIDWAGVEQKFDDELLYTVLKRNPHWIDEILLQTSIKKIFASS